MKNIIIAVSVGLLVSGCGVHNINSATPESEKEASNFSKQEVYDKAVKENKDKWVNIGYSRAMNVVKKYSSDIKAYEAGKYAIKSKFVTYPKVIASNINGKLTLETQGSEIKRNMRVKDIFDFYGRNHNLIKNDSEAHATQAFGGGRSGTSLQGAALGIPVLDKPKPARYHVQTATQNTKYKKPNQSRVINSNKNKQISVTLPKTQKSLNAINEYSLNCLDHQNKYSCDFSNKMERDYFCSETGVCR